MTLDPTLTMLKELTDANAISGHEKEARDVMEKYIKPYRQIGVRWWTDLDCWEAGADGVARFVTGFAVGLDVLYLTIDLDVLPAAVAPGVSAPAALGVPAPLVVAAVRAAAATGKLALLDVVELNPALDPDGRTARTAARLISEAVQIVGSGGGLEDGSTAKAVR